MLSGSVLLDTVSGFPSGTVPVPLHHVSLSVLRIMYNITFIIVFFLLNLMSGVTF